MAGVERFILLLIIKFILAAFLDAILNNEKAVHVRHYSISRIRILLDSIYENQS